MSLYIITVILSALASNITLPVVGGFRVTLGVVALFAMIHAFRLKRPILLATVTGIVVVLVRILLESFRMPINPEVASNYFLEVFFYFGFGFLYYYSVIHNQSAYPLPLVIALAISDAGGNFLEYLLRTLAADQTWTNTSLVTILLAASVRAILIVFFIWITKRIFTKYVDERSSYD